MDQWMKKKNKCTINLPKGAFPKEVPKLLQVIGCEIRVLMSVSYDEHSLLMLRSSLLMARLIRNTYS